MVEVDDWQEEHAKVKVEKKAKVVRDVIVASGSDDGTAKVWRPLLVSEQFFFGPKGKIKVSI